MRMIAGADRIRDRMARGHIIADAIRSCNDQPTCEDAGFWFVIVITLCYGCTQDKGVIKGKRP